MGLEHCKIILKDIFSETRLISGLQPFDADVFLKIYWNTELNRLI